MEKSLLELACYFEVEKITHPELVIYDEVRKDTEESPQAAAEDNNVISGE